MLLANPTDFKANRLPALQKYLGGSPPTDSYLLEVLKAAQADAQRQLRVLLEPTTIFAGGEPTPDELASIGASPYLVEPAYDFEPNQWSSDAWGFLPTRQKPVQSVSGVQFVWPGTGTIFTMPENWIRLDRKYGHIQFVPIGGSAQTMPLSIYMMQSLGGGRVMPQMIKLRYVAGLANAAQDYPDLVDLIQRMAALRMLQSAVLAASSSISADGLSQSSSAPDLGKMGDSIDAQLGRIRDQIHGVRMAFC